MTKPKEAEEVVHSDVPAATDSFESWGERLSVDDQIRLREPLVEFQRAVVEDSEARKRHDQLVRKFRLGAKMICAKQMWKKILVKKGIADKPIPEQAESLGMIRQQVANYARGELSLVNLIAFVTDLEMTLGSLGPLPPLRSRALAGYRRAIAWIEGCEDDGSKSIADEQLLIVFVLLGDKEFQSRSRAKDVLDVTDWEVIASRVGADAVRRFGKRCKKFAPDKPDVLRDIHQRWGEAVLEIRDAIPHRWLKGASA